MKRLRMIAAVGVLCSAVALSRAGAPAKFEPADGVCYHGVCLPGIWNEAETRANLKAYQDQVTKVPLVLHSWFVHAREQKRWRTWHRMNETPDGRGCIGPVVDCVEISRKLGMVPVIAWAWDDFQDMADSPRLQDVVAGKQDWLIDDWIKGVKAFKDPIFIRLSHEMDGDWYPYSEGYKSDPKRNTAKDYIAYYRHIVDRFRKAGVTNVAWVWCVSGDRSGGLDWPDYYPGDEYVDWAGIDPYSARNPRDMIEPFLKLYGHKPVMLPEFGTGEEHSKWNTKFAGEAAWVRELFDVVEENKQIKAICWFQWDAPWQLQRVEAQRAEFAKRIANPRYGKPWSPR